MTTQANDEPEKVDLKSLDIAEEKRRELLRLFPEVRTEGGKIDFDRLKLTLGETVDVGRERYGMNWPGKAECFRTLQAPSTATLRPMKDESVNWDTTENLIIEGDNLEVLKLLQKAYLGKVKMIYIDPPYNTGNDFIYPDNYSESLQTYLEYTGQVDAGGKKFGTNPDTDGRFHSKWLNMMYPRLSLARNLLRNDGVIMVSIDDREIANLRLLMNTVFGENNAVGELVWQAKKGGGSDSGALVVDHEYVVCFARDLQKDSLGEIQLTPEPLDQRDSKGPYRRGRELNKWGSNSLRADRPTMFFAVPGPNKEDVYPIRPDGREGCWRWGKPKMLAAAFSGDIDFVARGNGVYTAYEKIRSTEPRRKPFRTWSDDVGQTSDGTKSVKDLFNGEKLFDFAKPTKLLRHLIKLGALGTSDDTPIVLDFFAGSGTTAHAVLETNAEERSDCRFVLVQLPEPTGRSDFKTITAVARERVKRCIGQMLDAESKTLPVGSSDATELGFRAFTLAESNFVPWVQDRASGAKDLETQLEMNVHNILPGRSPEDLLAEILLKEGFPLTIPVLAQVISGQPVTSVADGLLLACFERSLTLDTIKGMADMAPQRIVCLDEGFGGNDQLKANAVQIFKSKGIVFRTV